MKKIWERLTQPTYFPGEHRPRWFDGGCEVIGQSPGPDFVAPVMALDALPFTPLLPEPEPLVIVGYLGDMGEILIADGDEEEIADAMDFYYNNWPRAMWPNYTLLEVKT